MPTWQPERDFRAIDVETLLHHAMFGRCGGKNETKQVKKQRAEK